MNKENFCFYIKARTGINILTGVIYHVLYSVYREQAPCYATIKRWAKKFPPGHEGVEDEARPGTPLGKITSENIKQVCFLIDDDPHTTRDEMQERTGLSYGIVQRVIIDHLKFKKVIGHYISKDLTDFQRTEQVRI